MGNARGPRRAIGTFAIVKIKRNPALIDALGNLAADGVFERQGVVGIRLTRNGWVGGAVLVMLDDAVPVFDMKSVTCRCQRRIAFFRHLG